MYEPDAGANASFHGVQYTHFEDNNGNLCAASGTPANPPVVSFGSSVAGIAFASDASVAVALLQNTSGGYSLAQDVFGTAIGSLTPVGAPYDLSVQPTPAPTVAPTNGASPGPSSTPVNAPLIADAQSVAILGTGSSAVALTLGTPVTGSPSAIVALTSLTNAPPQYGNSVPFTGSSYTLTSIPQVPRNIVRIGVKTDSNGNVVALVRGPQDLLAFSVSAVATGFQFDATADDATLGTSATLRGTGAVALDPADAGRALVGGTSAGQTNVLTLVTGLPGAIQKTAQLALPGNIRSIAITNAGVYAVVATDVGLISVGGIDSSALRIVAPFAPSPLSASASAPQYTTCTGAGATLTNVSSVGVSSDQKYIVALGSGAGVACPSGNNASIVALPYNPATGGTPSPAPASTSSATPGPSQFTQNNVIAPPAGADYLYVH